MAIPPRAGGAGARNARDRGGHERRLDLQRRDLLPGAPGGSWTPLILPSRWSRGTLGERERSRPEWPASPPPAALPVLPQGEFDLWADGWPGPDQYVQFSVAGIPEPVTVRQAPPPSQPRGAPRFSLTDRHLTPPRRRRQILAFLCTNYVAKVPCGSVPPAPSDSAPTARRSLLRSSKGPAPAPSCTGYFRQARIPAPLRAAGASPNSKTSASRHNAAKAGERAAPDRSLRR